MLLWLGGHKVHKQDNAFLLKQGYCGYLDYLRNLKRLTDRIGEEHKSKLRCSYEDQ